MRYWDSSAIVPLLVAEAASAAALASYRSDPVVITWWATEVECASVLGRLEREGALSGSAMVDAIDRLEAIAAAWLGVLPAERVRRTARRLLRVHPLRAADALQLGAAIVATEDRPESLPFVTFDDRLAEAAAKEGFAVSRPA